MTTIPLVKQPWESKPYTMKFSRSLPSSEDIASVTSVTAANQGEVSGSDELTVGDTSASGQDAQAILSGGTDGELYLVTFRVTGDNGTLAEEEGYLRVRELP